MDCCEVFFLEKYRRWDDSRADKFLLSQLNNTAQPPSIKPPANIRTVYINNPPIYHIILLSKQFIGLCANTNISTSRRKVLPAPWWQRQIFTVTNQLIPVGMCETIDWGGVIQGQSINKTAFRGISHFHSPLCQGGRGPWGHTREKTKQAHALFHWKSDLPLIQMHFLFRVHIQTVIIAQKPVFLFLYSSRIV